MKNFLKKKFNSTIPNFLYNYIILEGFTFWKKNFKLSKLAQIFFTKSMVAQSNFFKLTGYKKIQPGIFEPYSGFIHVSKIGMIKYEEKHPGQNDSGNEKKSYARTLHTR